MDKSLHLTKRVAVIIHSYPNLSWSDNLKIEIQGSPFLKIITCPTPRIFKFIDLLIWNKEEKSVQIHLPDW